jgi:hypothetical protein
MEEKKQSKLDVIEAWMGSVDANTIQLPFPSCITIRDKAKFINAHLMFLRGNSGNKAYIPYFNRLLQIYEYNKPKQDA